MVFQMTEQTMQELHCTATAQEIFQQPSTWRRTLEQMDELLPSLRPWLAQITGEPDFDLIFTGAGTSEYVGNALFVSLNPALGGHVRSYGTTDLVAAPWYYLSKDKPTLLVSFARSGDSPESVGAVEAADRYCGKLQHLFITCNRNGKLAQIAAERSNCRAIVLDDATNDRSFAMTSSFTNMYLAALYAFSSTPADTFRAQVEELCRRGQAFLDQGYTAVQELIGAYPFERIVYLGTGPLKGFAQESSLKMLELTAGNVAAVFDTPMGFRHGPKSIVHDNTLTVFYLSDDPASRRYELDLLHEMAAQQKGNRLLVVSGQDGDGIHCDKNIVFGNVDKLPDALLGLEYILVAQTIALFKSLSYHIGPDNPCPTGEVNRVVKGVTLYPVEVK